MVNRLLNKLAQKVWWKSWSYEKMYHHRLSKKIRIDLIGKMLPKSSKGRVLDIGCGAGFISKIYNAVGVDVKVDELKWASEQFENCNFVAEQAERLP